MVATAIHIAVILGFLSGFFCGRFCESRKHKYVGRLLITTDKDDGQTYLTCDLNKLESIDEINSFDTITLKIQRVL